MTFSHLKIKCIYLLTVLFMTAALLPGFIEGVRSGEPETILAPFAVVLVFAALGLLILVLTKKAVVSMSFIGEKCVIKTGEKIYKLSNKQFTRIKGCNTNYLRVHYRDGDRNGTFIIRRSRILNVNSVKLLDEMHGLFPNAVISA